MRQRAEGGHRVGQHDFGQAAGLQQIQHQRGRAHFQQQAGGQHIGVPVQQVQAAVFARVGQRFVARVDDGAVELHPLEQVVVDVIGPLADLIIAPGPGPV
jgi:DNA-binding transcriptional LysR family regulator